MTEQTIIKTDINLLPEEGNPEVGPKIFEILDEILEDKNEQGLPQRWNRAYELTRNKHWKTAKTKHVSLVSANLIHTHRQRTVSHLTDNNPTFDVSKEGQTEENEDGFDTLLKMTEHWWANTEQQHKLEMSVGDGEQNGCTVEKIRFNPDIEYGKGEIDTEIIAPYYFGVYPTQGCIDNQRKEANVHFYPMGVREAKRRWPDKAHLIKSDSEILEKIQDYRSDIAGSKSKKGIVSTFQSVVKKMTNFTGGSGDDADEVLIVECWVKDYTTAAGEPVVKQNEDGTEYREIVQEPKYPGEIRCVTTCCAGEVILSDKPNPSINPELPREKTVDCFLYDKFPFIVAQSVTDTHSMWGMSDYEQLEQLAMQINKSLSQIVMMKDKAARLKIINPINSGVENAELSNANSVIRPQSEMLANAIRYMDPPKLDPNLWKSVDLFKDIFFLVAGSFDLEQAQTPGRDVIAYKAIAALLEQVATRLKGKIRNYSKLIRERGRMCISLMQNWYTEKRWYTYEEDGEKMAGEAVGIELIVPAKLTVVSGSTMPRSRVQEREEAIVLFKMGAIDQPALLKAIDFPDWKKIVQRMKMGPIGEFLERMAALGAPEPMLMLLGEVAQMDEKEFERAAEKGEIPSLQQTITPQIEGPDPQVEMDNQIRAAETESKIMTAQANANKASMETLLVKEKIVSEQLDQWVRVIGVQMDKEQLEQKRLELLARLDDQEFKQWEGVVSMKQNRPGFNEKGRKSNNARV